MSGGMLPGKPLQPLQCWSNCPQCVGLDSCDTKTLSNIANILVIYDCQVACQEVRYLASLFNRYHVGATVPNTLAGTPLTAAIDRVISLLISCVTCSPGGISGGPLPGKPLQPLPCWSDCAQHTGRDSRDGAAIPLQPPGLLRVCRGR
jgi:hypothetical protein